MQSAAQLLAYGLFFFSGATALVYQVVWLRDLSLIFGASFHATSIVLASFMGGLAIGGFIAGRYSESLRRPLRVYGILEIAIAVFAVALPPLLQGIDNVYVSAAHSAGSVTPALNGMRFAFAFGVLVLPTIFMGATLPVLIRFMVHAHGELGTRLSLLYGINTLGAAAGAATAGFVFLPQLGVSATQSIAVGANLLIGILAIGIDMASGRDASADEVATAETDETWESASRGSLPLRLTFIGTGIAGFAALGLEVMWTRAISMIIGSTTYSFTIMLSAFLVGICLGSWIHATFPLRKIHESIQFGVVLMLIGVTSFISTQLIPRTPQLVIWLNTRVFENNESVQFGTALITAFAVMLIPSIFMGIAFPLASQARARLVRKFGQPVGDTLGLNTLGSILGSLTAGFIIVPALGLQRGMVFSACLAAGYGLIVLASALLHQSRWQGATVSVVAAAALGLVIVGPSAAPRWDLAQLATFFHDRLQIHSDTPEMDEKRRNRSTELLYYREGQSSTVAVVDRVDRAKNHRMRMIAVNGKIVAADGYGDMPSLLLLGHVPVLLHPDPKSVLVIGYGAGVTMGSVSTYADIEELTLVDIEPAVLGSGRFFDHVNEDVLHDPRLTIVVQDGRNFLKTTTEKFDVITADPVHPWAAGSAYLYTTDYYKQASLRLNDGGMMAQWVPLTGLSVDNIKSITASFSQNFLEVSVWRTISDIVLVGTNTPTNLTMERLAERLAEPAVKRQLDWVNLGDPMKFMARLVLEDDGVRIFNEGASINTDDNLYLEFSAPLAMGEMCELSSLCGMKAWYPPRIRMVDSWRPFAETNPEARDVLLRHKKEQSPKWMSIPKPELHPTISQDS